MNSSAMPWQDTLQSGHIVIFRFPHETPSNKPPKPRTTLVLAKTERHALLVYGTSQLRGRGGTSFLRRRGQKVSEIRVTRPMDIQAASLERPTIFEARRTILVDLDDPRFRTNSNGTAIIGTLPSEFMPTIIGLRKWLLNKLGP